MKPGAHLVMLAPGPRHLWQLREQLSADLKQREFSISLPAELTVLETESLSFSLDVSGEQRQGLDVRDLLEMFEKVRGETLADDSLLLG